MSAAPSTMGRLDLPIDGALLTGEVLQVRGSCLFEADHVARVELMVDDEPVGLARPYVESRGESADRLAPRHADSPVGAFEGLLVIEADRPGDELVVQAVAHSLDGRVWRSDRRRVRRRPPVDPTSASSPGAMFERSRAVIDSIGRDAGDGIVVITHDLAPGGAQLWLWDLLRQLHGQDGLSCTVVATGDGALRSRLESLGIEVHITEPMRFRSEEQYESRVRELALLVGASGRRAVLLNTLEVAAGADAAQRLGLPTVWAIHESYPIAIWTYLIDGDVFPRYARDRLEAALRGAAALVFEAEETSALFAPYTDRRYVVDYGVDTAAIDEYRARVDRDATRAGLGIGRDERVLLVLGVVEPRKAQAMVVAAFDQIADRLPDVRLVMVGGVPSPYADAVRARIERSRARDRIRVVDITLDVYPWYTSADLLVCPSDVESLPRSVLEAMAFGLPVLATDRWGISDLVVDGENGWLCADRDLESLVDSMARVLERDWTARHHIADEARRRIDRDRPVDRYARAIGGALRQAGEDPHADLAGPLATP